ncbi:hypothetical protein B0H19DRAFT_1133972 [Mycena capillaripes]|nr:hypothetical protein B0H19DRAFT_1133972 [Mycena capillaripes]
MDWLLDSTIESLPDEVLGTILKLVAESPALHGWNSVLPFPVAASRVSRRWRAITLAFPELWTTIRLSHRSRSWKWAPLFLKRSRSHPLDISVNLESYTLRMAQHNYSPEHQLPVSCLQHYYSCDLPIALNKALTIVGPHIRRWRTFALRCWEYQVQQLREYLLQSPGASQLQSAHISLMDPPYYREDSAQPLPPPSQLFGSASFRSLRVNTTLDLSDPTAFRTLHTLDIDFRLGVKGHLRAIRRILGALSPLKTLVIRRFHPRVAAMADPINAPTIRSLAISFSEPFYYSQTEGFDTVTNYFSFPNLEYLEIVGGFTGETVEDRSIAVSEHWEAPFFPRLRTLRLEDVGFSRNGLAFIHSLSRNITALQLIYTEGNHHLLEQRDDDVAWPALRALTVETRDGSPNPQWLGLYLAIRPVLQLTIFPWPSDVTLPVDWAPEIHWFSEGPSVALMDGAVEVGPKFYVNKYDMRPDDFEHVEVVSFDQYCCCMNDYLEDKVEEHLEELDDEIAEAFRVGGERIRAKGFWRNLRKECRRDFVARGVKNKRSKGRRQRCDIAEDFCFT